MKIALFQYEYKYGPYIPEVMCMQYEYVYVCLLNFRTFANFSLRTSTFRQNRQ